MKSETLFWVRARLGVLGGVLGAWIFYAACSSDPSAPTTVTLDPGTATLSVWALRTTPSASHPIVVSDDHQTNQIGFWLELNVSEFLTVGYADGVDASAGRRTKTSAAGVPLTGWSHLAATVRGSTDMTLYIDGVEVAGNYEGSGGTIVHDAGAPARIGLRTLGAPSFWEGLLDDIRIYDRSLSDTEIMQLFDEGGLNN